jgi:hypothetical protein
VTWHGPFGTGSLAEGINPEDIPVDATIEWVVRNQGEEVAKVNDLGHIRSGVRTLRNDEKTAYKGSHYMDCIVRKNGFFVGMNSIMVTIKSTPFPKRNSPRRTYRPRR